MAESQPLANVDHVPDLIDLGIGYGDTAVSPIEMTLEPANPAQTVFKTVDFNISAWIHSCLLRSLPINQVGIRKMQRQVKSALALLSIDDIFPFGCLGHPVAFSRPRDSVRSQFCKFALSAIPESGSLCART